MNAKKAPEDEPAGPSQEGIWGLKTQSRVRRRASDEGAWSTGAGSGEVIINASSRAEGSLNVGDLIEQKYDVLRLIGEGGMGRVFEVRHRVVKRRGALKCLHPHRASDPDMVERFVHEAQAAAAIGSEHIIDVTDAGVTDEGIPYLVMEYLDGRDLGQELLDVGAVSPERAASLMVQACKGLAAAHAKGIVHRDLKPENLLVASKGDGTELVKVLDFGMAKFHDLRLTDDGDTLGSPFFMSPEQFGGAADVDHRSDVYAIGVILYELVTGTVPFKGPSIGDLVYQVTMTEPRPPSAHADELPGALERMILKAMARQREDRYQTMDDLADALHGFLDTLPRDTPPPVPRMVVVPAGTFSMGSPRDEPGRFDDEVQHEAELTRAVQIQARPVTQSEWKRVMASNPSHFRGADRPVEMVSWFDAVAFCNALSEAHGIEPAYVLSEVRGAPSSPDFEARVEWRGLSHRGFRLPTEAEWERACRGGANGAEGEELELVAWFADNSGGGTHPVGQKRPNALGLFDTLGNVWEWCWDWYESYAEGTVRDPLGPRSAFGRVDRGGAWDSDASLCRPADRDGYLPTLRSNNLGFRLARTVDTADE